MGWKRSHVRIVSPRPGSAFFAVFILDELPTEIVYEGVLQGLLLPRPLAARIADDVRELPGSLGDRVRHWLRDHPEVRPEKLDGIHETPGV